MNSALEGRDALNGHCVTSISVPSNVGKMIGCAILLCKTETLGLLGPK